MSQSSLTQLSCLSRLSHSSVVCRLSHSSVVQCAAGQVRHPRVAHLLLVELALRPQQQLQQGLQPGGGVGGALQTQNGRVQLAGHLAATPAGSVSYGKIVARGAVLVFSCDYFTYLYFTERRTGLAPHTKQAPTSIGSVGTDWTAQRRRTDIPLQRSSRSRVCRIHTRRNSANRKLTTSK